jgi:hypothetical protein
MWNIVVGLIMLVGGLSGQLSLIGTDSSKALAAVGGAVLAWGLYQEWNRRRGPRE